MTKIKLCGLSRPCDILAANELSPDYIGFVFVRGSRRFVSVDRARELKKTLSSAIGAVGVFLRENIETVAALLNEGVIDAAQLHGDESEEYIARLRACTKKPIIKAFRIEQASDLRRAYACSADFVMLDAGGGSGTSFDWSLICSFERQYFLAGGLHAGNIHEAIVRLHPYAVDVSTGIETNGYKDLKKMTAFVAAVREEPL